MYSSMSRLVMRVSRFVLTLFSYPAYECTTNQSPGANRNAARRSATGSDSSASASPSSVATVDTSVTASVPCVSSGEDGASALIASSETSSYSGTALPFSICSRGASAGEDVFNHPGEAVVEQADDRHHDHDKHDHDARVRQQLLAVRPVDLPQLGNDLAEEPRDASAETRALSFDT